MTLTDVRVVEAIQHFIQEYGDDHCCIELLRFFGGYQDTRFSKLSIIHGMDATSRRLYVERALMLLIDKGAVRASAENGSCLYCLADDPPLRRLATELARLDWRQWQSLIRELYPVLGY